MVLTLLYQRSGLANAEAREVRSRSERIQYPWCLLETAEYIELTNWLELTDVMNYYVVVHAYIHVICKE